MTALLFALGQTTPVWRVFYEFLPGVALFRAPSQVIFLTGFSAATLAAFGADELLGSAGADQDSWPKTQRVLIGASILMASLAVLASTGALTGFWTAVVYPSIPPDRAARLASLEPLISRGAGIACILVMLTGLLVWARRAGFLNPSGLLVGLVLLVSIDGSRISAPFIQTMDFEAWSTPNPLVQTILDREMNSEEPYRLLSLERGGQSVDPSMHGIELAAGHHPNDLSRYRQLIGMVGSGFPNNLLNGNIRRLLNIRYIIWPDAEIGPSPETNVISRLQFRDGRVYQSLLAEAGLPRARLVGSSVVKSDEQAVAYMLSPDFDPAREVVLETDPPIALPGTEIEGRVTWTFRAPDTAELLVQTPSPALLVVANNWTADWHARVNGSEVDVLRAYHSLQAVPVPAGSSRVELWYRGSVVVPGAWLGGFLLLALAAANVDLLRRGTRDSAS